MKVPFSDCVFTKDEKEAVLSVLDSNWASKGKVSEEYEAKLEKYLGAHVCLLNSGSSALFVSLLANGVKAGDTVLVPDFTFVATASIPALMGCRILPVDCDAETFNVDDSNKDLLSGNPMIFTDVAGLPLREIEIVADLKGTFFIEDACEAFGAELDHKVGNSLHLTCFSFQATKQLSTVEGGCISSRNEELIAKCRKIADYGRTKEQYVHDTLGMNFRTTDLASAIGLVQLEKIDRVIARRNEIADKYRKGIPSLQFQKVPSYVTKHAYWTVLALIQRVDFDPNRAPRKLIEPKRELLLKMRSAGIDVREAWPPIRRQPCFSSLWVDDCTNADRISDEGILLPCFNSMSNEQLDYIIATANS